MVNQLLIFERVGMGFATTLFLLFDRIARSWYRSLGCIVKKERLPLTLQGQRGDVARRQIFECP